MLLVCISFSVFTLLGDEKGIQHLKNTTTTFMRSLLLGDHTPDKWQLNKNKCESV